MPAVVNDCLKVIPPRRLKADSCDSHTHSLLNGRRGTCLTHGPRYRMPFCPWPSTALTIFPAAAPWTEISMGKRGCRRPGFAKMGRVFRFWRSCRLPALWIGWWSLRKRDKGLGGFLHIPQDDLIDLIYPVNGCFGLVFSRSSDERAWKLRLPFFAPGFRLDTVGGRPV